MNDELDPQTKFLIDRFKNQATTSTRVLSIWIPTLLVLWLSGLEPKADKVKSFDNAKITYLEKINIVNERKILYDEKLLDKSDNGNIRLDEKLLKEALLSETKMKDTKELAKMFFEFPGGIKIAVPIVWAPTLWLFLTFTTLIYLQSQRYTLSALSARVASKLATNLKVSHLLHESLADAPFWLAPVPQKLGRLNTTPESHAVVLGWKNDYIQIGLCVFCYMALHAIQFRVAVLGFDFADSFGTTNERWLAPLISLIFCLASLAAVVDVFVPRALADNSPLLTESWVISRRRFLAGAITGTLALSLTIISNRLPIIRKLSWSPRFSRREANTRSEFLEIHSRGLHLNQRSKIAHYVTDYGQILGVSNINVKNFVPVKLADIKLPPSTPRANITRASATFELTALEYVKSKDYHAACQALMIGIRYDRIILTKVNKGPDIRLYDLLAGLSVRHNFPTFLEELTAQLSNMKTLQVTSGQMAALSVRLKNGKIHKVNGTRNGQIIPKS